MTTVAAEVATLEAETAQAVSAAQVAESAALQAVASAETLKNEIVARNAETVREWSDDLARNKEHFEWIKIELTELRTTVTTLQETTQAQATALQLLTLPPEPQDSASPLPADSLPSVVAVDLPAAAPPEPPPSSPPKPKRFKRL